jgi:hypothetical protein
MLSPTLVPAVVATLFLATGCNNSELASPSTDRPALAQVPATGNDNKLVIPIDEDLPSTDCGGGEILDVHQDGWIQVRIFPQPNNRNAELDVFHLVTTFTNSAGETFVFNEVGPDHYYFEAGDLFVATIGRIGGAGVIGRILINLTTDEVEFVAGKQFAGVEALACEALT